MTKSRQSVIKLRLSRLIKCLVALGCIKLAIMAGAVFDLPMPAWFSDTQVRQEQPVSKDSNDIIKQLDEKLMSEGIKPGEQSVDNTAMLQANIVPQPVPVPQINLGPVNEELPVGADAAELAAASKPRRINPRASASLPAPLLTAPGINPLVSNGEFFSTTLPLDTEGPGLPLAKAGVVIPDESSQVAEKKEEDIWDMLNVNYLPIPVLGSAKTAQAAALDMPVPQAPKGYSPFAPGEQTAPLARLGSVIPGAPGPGVIPPAVNPDGTPLAPRQPTVGQSGGYVPQPGNQGLNAAPAPDIIPQQSGFNPNMKAQELAKQQQDILMLRQQMDQRLKDLETAEDKMRGLLKDAQDMEDKKVKSLIQMYANMKPRTAAQALENMDERVAVKILAGMAPKQSGEILTYTNPVKTAKFTEMITRMRLPE